MGTEDESKLVGLTDGFWGYHRPSNDLWRDAYTQGVICLDTSALLDIYRFSPAGRREFLEILGRLRERIFIPHHVALEFQRRRVDAVADRLAELSSLRDEAVEAARKGTSVINRLSHRARSLRDQVPKILREQDEAKDAMLKFVDRVIDEYDLKPEEVAGGRDGIYPAIEALLAGRVSSPPSSEQLAIDHTEGERRLAESEPPGFKDRNKPENSTGDYLWWIELVRFAKSQPGPVLIVSNDSTKGDWTYEAKGIRIGPHTSLVEEMHIETGHRLLLTTVSELLQFAGTHLKSEAKVSDDTVAEAEDIARSAEIRRDAIDKVADRPRRSPVPIGPKTAALLAEVPQSIFEEFVARGLVNPRTVRNGVPRFLPVDVVKARILGVAFEYGARDTQLSDLAVAVDAEARSQSALFWKDGTPRLANSPEGTELMEAGWKRISPRIGGLADRVRSRWPRPQERTVESDPGADGFDVRNYSLLQRTQHDAAVRRRLQGVDGEPEPSDAELAQIQRRVAALESALDEAAALRLARRRRGADETDA